MYDSLSYLEFPYEESTEDQILHLLSFAILAPSTHNSQPWNFSIEGKRLILGIEDDLNLECSDSLGRARYISIGCFLANLFVAADYFGIEYKVKYDSRNIVITFSFVDHLLKLEDKRDSVILKAIVERQTVRQFSDEKKCLSKYEKSILFSNIDEIFHSLEGGISYQLFDSFNDIEKIAAATGDAVEEAHFDKRFRKEIASWIRSNFSSKKDGLHGYTLGVDNFPSLLLGPLIRFRNIGHKLAARNKDSILSSSGCFLFSSEDKYLSWIQIGQIAERLILSLVELGYQSSIHMAAIEIGDYYTQLPSSKAHGSSRPQFLFCFGRAKNRKKARAPRYSLVEILQRGKKI